jgi:hypothetical protein
MAQYYHTGLVPKTETGPDFAPRSSPHLQHPAFLMPYMTARTADVEGPLFLRKFGVPFWALARVFGGDSRFWYRLECTLGRFPKALI